MNVGRKKGRMKGENKFVDWDSLRAEPRAHAYASEL